MSEKITMVIPRDWTKPVTVEAVGFTGPSCLEATRRLEDALGGAAERVLKPEFTEVAPEQGLANGEEG